MFKKYNKNLQIINNGYLQQKIVSVMFQGAVIEAMWENVSQAKNTG